jgi:hypothetical protein
MRWWTLTDPVDILAHLMIGSEGTLGFISRVTYHTVPDYAHKASALVFFPDIETACRAVIGLRQHPVDCGGTAGPRLPALGAHKPGMPPLPCAGLSNEAAAADRGARARRPAICRCALTPCSKNWTACPP